MGARDAALRRLVRGGFVALTLLACIPAQADVGPPAHLRISESEPGLYTAQWRVPKMLPPRAVPAPEFPQDCRPAGESAVLDQAGAWLFTRDWRCETGLAGESIGMRYPFPDLALTTVVRVELLSGDRFAHLLAPGESSWRLPEGTAAPDPLLAGRRALLAGIYHAAGSWIHWLFVLAAGLLGRARSTLRVVTAFTLGQVGGALAALPGLGIGIAPAEIGFAVAVALLARQALRPEAERSRLIALAAFAGLLHGLGLGAILTGALGADGGGTAGQLLALLGMDALHLAGAGLVVALWTALARNDGAARLRAVLAYGAGATSLALALAVAFAGRGPDPAAATAALTPPVPATVAAGSAVAGSRRVAPAAPDAPVQSFLVVEPFEVRHEAKLRLAGFAQELGLEPGSTLEVGRQSALSRRLAAVVADGAAIRIDGEVAVGTVRRADFMMVDISGALPRLIPVPENVDDAVIGVVVVYPTEGIPQEVLLGWEPFPAVTQTIPATLIDPESVASATLTPEEPSLTWTNELVEDPIPTVDVVEVEPARLPLPLLSLPLIALASIALVGGVRGRRRDGSLAAARLILALAVFVGPLAQVSVDLPGSAGRTPSDRQARRILSGLLPNVYRALEYRDELAIYDQLAVSVTGETLTQVYLEQRRALQMEERGGAQARVEAVEVLEAGRIEARETGFQVRAIWTVGGMVTHFGHRHFRQNRYDAWIGIVPVADTWKIRSIEILEQDRLQ